MSSSVAITTWDLKCPLLGIPLHNALLLPFCGHCISVKAFRKLYSEHPWPQCPALDCNRIITDVKRCHQIEILAKKLFKTPEPDPNAPQDPNMLSDVQLSDVETYFGVDLPRGVVGWVYDDNRVVFNR